MTHLKTAQKLKKNWNTDDFIIYDSLRDVIEIGANVDLAESMEIRDEDYEKDYLMTVNLNDDCTISYESLLNSYTNVREKIIEDALGEVDAPSFPVPAIPGKILNNRTEQING
jgi:hypothetical protein